MKIKQINPNEKVAILVGKLIDGITNQPQQKQAILIEEGKIKKIIAQEKYFNQNFEPYEQLTLNNFTILPGLIDAHVHLALDGANFKKTIEEWKSPVKTNKRITKQLTATLQQGIVAVRDGGDRANIALNYQQKVASSSTLIPKIIATGQAIYKEDHYGSFLGTAVKTKSDLKRRIKEIYNSGSDQLKVLVSGIISFSNYGEVGEIQFSEQELKRIVALARQYGLKVMAHASSDQAVRRAIKAEVDSIEHGYFISKESLKLLAETQIPWIPTVVPVANQLLVADEYSPNQQEVIKKSYHTQLEMIDKGADLGVKLGIGTDAGAYQVKHGHSLWQELNLFNQTSLSPLEIIKVATYSNAQIIGQSELGSIQKSKKPQLIGVKGDPTQDLSLLKNPELLIY
ncbi:amidohydrolase family protein [Natroniella sulfidigena]|uniref:amidohydrolase family protein n=1 Tax=Natroniella sulfidigena TaxID=723921 RepID=UPI00200AC6BE|nr:amidohydrolase family protein [Natroniella sulfidigena]MCK8815806.1 amidohydrolase family protein [Natroniella sulfidigena]